MAAIEYEVATAKVCKLSPSLIPVHDKDALVGRARTVISLIHWCAKQQRLAPVNGLQGIATNLREQRVALDLGRNGFALELQADRWVLDACTLQLPPHRFPECGVDFAHFRKAVHRQADLHDA